MDGFTQVVTAGRLGKRDIEGFLPAPAFAGVGKKGRQCHERSCPRRTAERSDLAGSDNPIHDRHFDIKEDEIVGEALDVRKGFFAMFDGVDFATHAAQQCRDQNAGSIRILGEQHARPRTIETA